jgi:hypothetical protein
MEQKVIPVRNAAARSLEMHFKKLNGIYRNLRNSQ